MARRTEKIAPRGFKRLKLKLGGRDGLDADRVQAVQAVTEPAAAVRRQRAWTLDEALEYLPQMELQYCEQPLIAGDPDGPELKRRSPVPIYVDEDCHVLADVAGVRASARTGSTSSWRSRAASARRCGWCTPPARSVSA